MLYLQNVLYVQTQHVALSMHSVGESQLRLYEILTAKVLNEARENLKLKCVPGLTMRCRNL